MSFSPSDSEKARSYHFLPWLLLSAALLVIVLNALFSAVHSPLGQEISAGESPGFAWIRANINICMGLGLVFLMLVSGIQLRWMKQSSFKKNRWLRFLIGLEVCSIVAIALMLYFKRTDFLAVVYAILILSILGQGIISFRRPAPAGFNQQEVMLQKPATNVSFFFILLFILSAAISLLEPSRYRFEGQIVLDSNFESLLGYVFPPILSGITGLWLGISLFGIIIVISRMFFKLRGNKDFWIIYFWIFFSCVALFMGFLLITLYYAVSWQINNLHLITTVWQLHIFLSVSGAILFSSAFFRIVPRIPQPQKASLMGIVSLTFGAAILFPITWLLTSRRNSSACWVTLLISVLCACGLIGYAVLFGNMFNSWFTTFSYLKGAILKIISVVAAGAALLLAEQFLSHRAGAESPSNFRRYAIAAAIAAVLGFLPFYALGKYPEVKVAVLQFNELTRVDTSFAREMANALGFGKRIQLGQRPPQNGNPHPWPQPWILKKSHPSLLPANFNLLVIVVDALRGDAFHSAGYHRNLTPFLDRWAGEESISFRRAYSQGGGSFAAFPFLVAGRSRLDLYAPGLYRQNLYFKLARAEGIQHYMLMKEFGPRDIYPPDFPVTELAIPRAVSDRRSATADEVFQSARNTIGAIPRGERFLCFLQLMDVHNDLWKKKDGKDFGDTPRDLYDHNLSYIDRAFSRFISWLKQEAIYDRTVILFTSDHGEQFWEHGASLHGHTVYEEEIRIPLILVTHGIRKRFDEVPVIAADMAPTIVDLAGYSVDPPYDDPRMGISLLPLILGKERQRYVKRDVIGRASFKRRYFMYRNWEWKLVYFAELDLLQLFNVLKDPLERNNWLNERPYLAATMEQELVEYLEKVEGKTYREQLSNLLKK